MRTQKTFSTEGSMSVRSYAGNGRRRVRVGVRRFFKLLKASKSDKALLLRAWGVLWLFRLGLWFLPFRYMRRFIDNTNRMNHKTLRGEATSADRLAGSVIHASRCVAGGQNCLLRAMSLHYILQRGGYSSELHIGVNRPEEGGLAAHAWVENEGIVLIGDLADLPRFTQLRQNQREDP